MRLGPIRRSIRSTFPWLLTLLLAAILAWPNATVEAAVTRTNVTVSPTGEAANGNSEFPSVSADGHYVAFSSGATNLVTTDTNGYPDVFVRDTVTRTTELVSLTSTGRQANSSSAETSISADGRYVAFVSNASNLVPGDTNGVTDIFVRDRQTGTTERVNISSSGQEANANSQNPVISGDGRFVAFRSPATNLVSGVAANTSYLYVHDRETHTTTMIAPAMRLDEQGKQAVATFSPSSRSASFSTDDRYIAFDTDAALVAGDTNETGDVYVYDRLTGTLEWVSVSSTGQGSRLNENNSQPSISGDGRYVAFISSAAMWITGLPAHQQVWVHDRVTGVTELASVSSSGVAQNSAVKAPSISADGRYVAFVSSANNLVSGATGAHAYVHDRWARTTQWLDYDLWNAPNQTARTSISADGTTVVYLSANSIWKATFTPEGPAVAVLSKQLPLTEGGAPGTYQVQLTTQPSADVTVTIGPNSQLTASPATLTFTAANWNVPQTITVWAVADDVAEGAHTGTITHNSTSADTRYKRTNNPTLTVQITDSSLLPTVLTVPDVSAPCGGNAALTATLTSADMGIAGKSVTFSAGGTIVGTAITDATGTALLNYAVTQLPGSYPIMAAFDTDGVYGSAGKSGTLTVTPPVPTIGVDDAAGPANTSVTLQALISDRGTPVAGKTLSFTIAGSPVGTAVTDADGYARLPYNINKTPGRYEIRASFGGDSSYAAAAGTGTLSVLPLPTTLTLTSPAADAYGEQAALQASLSSGGAPVSGRTVLFQIGNSPLGTAMTDANGLATLSYTVTAAPGTYTIQASFAGDNYYAGSTASGSLVINQAATQISVNSPATGPYLGTAQLLATLSSDTVKLSDRTLEFRVRGTLVGSAVTDSQGMASITYPLSDAPGDFEWTVTFAGDATCLASSGSGTLTITPAGTDMTVSNRAVEYGTATTLEAVLTHNGTGLEGKSVAFSVDQMPAGTAVTDSTGRAALPYTADLATGPHTVTASFVGDANYAAGSGTGTLTVNQSSTVLTVADAGGRYGLTIGLRATLTAIGKPVVGKEISFLVDGAPVGTATTDAAGVSTLSYVITSAPGPHNLIAAFVGDTAYASSNDDAALTVDKATTTVTAAPASGTSGQSVTLTATLTANGAPLAGKLLSFSVDGAQAGTAETQADGTALLPYTITQAAGPYTILVTFAGDAVYASTSGSAALSVAPPPPLLTVADTTCTYGQSVSLRATLSVGGVPLEGKPVLFAIGSTTVGTGVTTAGGIATVTTVIAQNAGSYPIYASFSGDSTTTRADGSGTLTVSQAAPTLTVPNVSGTNGQTVTLQATLTDGRAPLAGRPVAFRVAGTPVGTASTDATGLATLTYTVVQGSGAVPIEASFDGDTNYLGAAASGTLNVAAAPALSVTPASGTYGSSVILTANLSAGGAALAGRTVSFAVDGVTVGTATTDAAGNARVVYLITQGEQATPYDVTATFAGDATHGPAMGIGDLTVSAISGVLSYTGTMAARPAPHSQTISAVFTPNQSGGDLTKAQLQFDLVNTTTGETFGPYILALGANGSASMDQSLPEGTYTVTVSLLGGGYFTAPSTTQTMLLSNSLPAWLVNLSFPHPKFATVQTNYAVDTAPLYVNIHYNVVKQGPQPESRDFWAWTDNAGNPQAYLVNAPGTYPKLNSWDPPKSGKWDFTAEIWFGDSPDNLLMNYDTITVQIVINN